MAHPHSVAIGGYFKSPEILLPRLASLVRLTGWNHQILDPAAGEGEAVITLAQNWGDAVEKLWAIEMEKGRFEALKAALNGRRSWCGHGDAFLATWRKPGVSVLYLNPPYDYDDVDGRVEHTWLKRFTGTLRVDGGGVLMFVVPITSLAVSAEYLARHYDDIRCWRFPDPEYAAFGQGVLVGRRSEKPFATSKDVRRIEAWAAAPAGVEVLPETCEDPLEIEKPAGYDSWSLQLARFDVEGAAAGVLPWEGHRDYDAGVEELIGMSYPVANPPKPVHVARALTAGLFNGLVMTSDRAGDPRIIAKGVNRKRMVTVDRKFDDEGNVVSTTQVERPALEVWMLRLDTLEFRQVGGVEPTGDDDPAAWTIADLLERYRGALLRLMERQFPALHDSAREDHRIELPRLERRPFEVQYHAIVTALALMSRGEHPIFQAEVGSGKTTMALFVLRSLAPEHFNATCRELERRGLETSALRPIHRALVLCPPHLLTTWRTEAGAVDPAIRVKVVRQLSDLDDDEHDVYLLSREAAKLGHKHEAARVCSRCGAQSPHSVAKILSGRLRCEARRRDPSNIWARIAEDLAVWVVQEVPDGTAEDLLEHRKTFSRRFAYRSPKRPLDRRRERHAAIKKLARRLWLLAQQERSQKPLGVLVHLARYLAEESAVAAAFRRHAETLTAVYEADAFRSAAAALLGPDETGALRSKHLAAALQLAVKLGTWSEGPLCGEPLFWAVSEPRRFPLAKAIQRRYGRLFDAVVVDESHEYSSDRTAQTIAFLRLVGLSVPVLSLTGSLMNGYASSLFMQLWALTGRVRSEYSRSDRGRWVEAHGYNKVRIDERKAKEKAYGRVSDRENGVSVVGEAPGVTSGCLVRYLLPTSIIVHKADLEIELPPLSEQQVPIEPDAEVLGEYRRLEAAVMEAIQETPRAERHRMYSLLGVLQSYPDRCTEDTPFHLYYPPDGSGKRKLLEEAIPLPADYVTAKERWLLEELRAQLARGRRCLIFPHHTGTSALPDRLVRLVKQVTSKVIYLDVKKVSAAKREEWIDKNVTAKDVEVLVVNPNAVRTGLNNLVGFSTIFWFEVDYDPRTYRQGNGRLHRPRQTQDVEVFYLFHAGTAQERAVQLLAAKVTASLQVDALDVRSALEEAGAIDDDASAIAVAQSFSQALYGAMGIRPRRSPHPTTVPRPSRGAQIPETKPVVAERPPLTNPPAPAAGEQLLLW